MISPYDEPERFKELLSLLSYDDLGELLKTIDELLRYEIDGYKIMRLLDNREILEDAIDNYFP